MSEVVDLRSRGASGPGDAPDTAAPDLGPAPPPDAGAGAPEPARATPFVLDDDDEPGTPRSGRSRPAARTVVIALLLGVLAVVALEVFLLPVAYRQRQQHLADQYRVASNNIRVGDAAFLIQAPSIGLNQVVVRGADPELLRGAPGWRVGSATPGQGNTVVLGHSTRWGYPFGGLSDLKGGTIIYVRTRGGLVYTYKVTRVRSVSNDDTKVMDPSGPSRLTLVTSAGGPLDSSRTVVQAQRNGPQPEVPKKTKVPLARPGAVGSFDERGTGGLLLLLAGFVVVALGVVGYRELSKRYRTPTVVAVAAPAIMLGLVLVLFNLDAFLPITY